MSERAILPLSSLIRDIIPTEWIGEIDNALDFIGLDGTLSNIVWNDGGMASEQRIVILRQLRFDLPLISGAQLFFGSAAADLPYFDFILKTNPELSITVQNLMFGIHFPQSILQTYKKDVDEKWIVDDEIDGYDLVFQSGFTFDLEGNIDLKTPAALAVKPLGIGKTGVVLDLEHINFISGSIPEDLEDILPYDFVGLWISKATFHFTKPGTTFPPIELNRAGIGSGGFTGTISLGEYARKDEDIALNILNKTSPLPSYLLGINTDDSELNGMQVIFQYFGITFEQSIPASGEITGHIFMAFADKWMKFKASLGGPDGDFMLEIGGTSDAPLISLDHEYFEIKADSIAYKLDDGIHYAVISGSIKPKIEGFDWPEMKIEGLSISSEGDINIPGGWIKAPETITLNFGAFKIGINEIGFGNEGEEPELKRQWLGFSGELNLVEGLDLKASVEGLKFSWLKEPATAGIEGIEAGSKDVQVSLKGIAVEFEIPNTLSFKGSVKYEELTAENNGGTGLTGKLFRGNIDLNLMSVRLQIEAELIIGKLKDAEGHEFTTFFIVMGVQLPAGIPLGATGTSLYGLKGLGAVNSGPTKTEEQNWYEWYKAEPEREITSMKKWMPMYDNYAFGAGVTIGTMFDDGFTLNMSVMLVILLPGPVIVLEGKANLLKQRSEGQQEAGGPEGAFYLLAVLDGRAGTFMLNVDVKYSLEDVITIGASLEAFFDFNNSSNWYLYIGRKEPDTKRIRAEILSLFHANAYFMIDNTSLQTGASVGFDFRKKYGPVSIVLIAKIGFDATIFWKPMQLEGSLELEASLGIKVFGIGLELYLYMLLEGRVPKPYWIHGVAEVGLKLFWPIPDIKLRVELEWSQPAETLPAWPLLKDCTFTHHKGSGSTWPMLIADSENPPPWIEFPVIPVDARPILTFARPVNNLGQHEGPLGTIPIFNTQFDEVGDQRFTYKLDKDNLVLEEYDGAGWVSKRSGINTNSSGSSTTDIKDFIIERDNIINIQDDLDPNEPQLQLWKYSARDHVNDYGREDYNDTHPACNEDLVPKWITINWQGVSNNTQYNPSFMYAGLSFVSNEISGGRNPVVMSNLLNTSTISIQFPESIIQVFVRINKPGFRNQNEATAIKLTAYVLLNGVKVGNMEFQNNSIYYTGISKFNSVVIENKGISIVDIRYMTHESMVDQLIGTNDPSPSAIRQNMNGSLILEPSKFYRLKINTSVDSAETAQIFEAENYIYFRTDEGPGINEVSKKLVDTTDPEPSNVRELSHKDKPINLLETYIDQTLPKDGALNHYLHYDVGALFNESYVAELFKKPIEMRFRDRNGKLLDNPEGTFIPGFLPLLPYGLLSWLKDKQEGGCLGQEPQITPAPYLNFALQNSFKAHSLYTAEMITETDLGEQSLYKFQFSTSRFSNFTEHIVGSYPENSIKAIELPSGTLRSTFDLGIFTIEQSKYHAEVARFNSEEVDLLKKKEYLISCRENYQKLNERIAGHFKELDSVMLTSLTAINMENRPSAAKFEIFHIPLIGSEQSLLIIESPEPIDWLRIKATAKTSTGRPFKVGFVWNEDKTRAFMFRASVPRFDNENYTFDFNFNGDKDPISGMVMRDGLIVEEQVKFELVLMGEL